MCTHVCVYEYISIYLYPINTFVVKFVMRYVNL